MMPYITWFEDGINRVEFLGEVTLEILENFIRGARSNPEYQPNGLSLLDFQNANLAAVGPNDLEALVPTAFEEDAVHSRRFAFVANENVEADLARLWAAKVNRLPLQEHVIFHDMNLALKWLRG